MLKNVNMAGGGDWPFGVAWAALGREWMNQLTDKTPHTTTYNSILFLRVQLMRKPAPEDPEGPNGPKQLMVECGDHLQQLHQAQDALMMANANRVGLNAELKQVVTDSHKLVLQIAREVRAHLQGDSKDPIYLKIFPKSPTELSNPNHGYSHHIDYIHRLRDKIAADADYELFRNHIPDLEANMQKIRDQIEKRAAAISAENDATIALNQVAEKARNFYNHAYARLLMAYNSDYKIVESCFHKIQTKKKAKKEGEKEPPAESSKDENAKAKK